MIMRLVKMFTCETCDTRLVSSSLASDLEQSRSTKKCRAKQFCRLLGKPTVNRWCYLLVREMRWAVKIRVPTLKIIPTIITTGFSITTSLASVATGADAGASYSSVRCGSSAMMMRLLPVSYGSTPLLVTTARPHRTTRPANVCFTPSCLMA